MFFWVSSGFRLTTLPGMPFLASVWTETIDAREACSSFHVVLGYFVTSWMSRCCALGGILEGQPLLGRVATVPSFFQLEIMNRAGSNQAWWSLVKLNPIMNAVS